MQNCSNCKPLATVSSDVAGRRERLCAMSPFAPQFGQSDRMPTGRSSYSGVCNGSGGVSTIGFMNVTSRLSHTLAANRTFVRRARGCVQHNYFEATTCDGAALLIGFATTSVLFASSAGTFAPG